MQNPCQDSYYTLFSSYPMLLDYHEEQAKNSRWIRCKVADLQVEPLGESSPLIGNLSAFAAGTSQEAVKDTAENLGLAMRVNGELYPVRMTAYKSLLDRAKIGGTALPKLSREVLAEVLNECLKLYEQDKWAIYENAHEAIINPCQFVLVQRLLELDTRTSPRENGLFPLAGLLCCGDCGGAMVRKTQTSGNKRFCYYTCSNHKNTGECTSHRISQKQLEDAVLRLLQEHIRMLAELDGCLQTIRNAPVHRLSIRKAEDRLAAVEADIDRYRKLKISAYEDMCDGILSKEDYLDIKEQYEMRISEAQLAEEQIRHEIDLYIENGNAPQRWIQEFLDHRNIQSLTRIVAVECIDHIMIYEGKRIEVTFAHMQDYEALVSRVKDYYINQREVG